MTPFTVHRGNGPIILGLPHGGISIPSGIAARLNDNGRKLADTDWHIAKLYDGLLPNVTTVAATFHRYVIDANRDPAGISLYPGQNSTELCPTTDFDGLSIWKDGERPSPGDISERRQAFHVPYHNALAAEVSRIKSIHGFALLFDCHSIRSYIPFLFEGRLPDLNIGTNNGKTCAPLIESTVMEIAAQSPFSSVLNGRFRGGWTTRHYGQPQKGVHAIQLEIAQSAYLESEAAPWRYSEEKAAVLRETLRQILEALNSLNLNKEALP